MMTNILSILATAAPTIADEAMREPAIRGFIIVGCFVVLPVVFAWGMQRMADRYEERSQTSQRTNRV